MIKTFVRFCDFLFRCLSDYLKRFSAESEGFEPPVQLPVHRISSAAHSTTLAAFLPFLKDAQR